MEKRHLRYQETGPIHLDFHRTTNGTITYIKNRYGMEFLKEIFRRTAHDVYRAIHNDLKAGDPEHLVGHWQYFIEREGGEYTIERNGDTITMNVTRCPAYDYLVRSGVEVDPDFHIQTIALNEAFSEGTPFEITTQILGPGRYVQTIRRRKP